MPQDSHIPFYHTTIRRKLQEVFKIFLRKLCGVKFPSKCNSKCCCCGCLENLRICLLADGSTCPCCPLRGGLPSLSPACPAFSLLCRPHPPARARRALFPGGEGGDFLFSYARGFAPCIPEAEPKRRWEQGRTTRPAGGLPCLLPANRAFSLLSCPHPPAPFPAGRGSSKVYFAGGSAPGAPALNRLRHLQNLPSGCPAHGSLRFGAKQVEPPFYDQCRQPRREGDRGRWNYPSQATAAFEMVLSPGAGRTSAAGVQPPAGHHSGKVGR